MEDQNSIVHLYSMSLNITSSVRIHSLIVTSTNLARSRVKLTV